MKILKNQGSFKILTISDNPIQDIAIAARTCYQTQEKASRESNLKLVKSILTRGHMAMIEFADMTVQFNNCSRGQTHEQVRHRLTSPAQESTRYVDESNLQCVVPPHKDETQQLPSPILNDQINTISLEEWFKLNEQMYKTLIDQGWKKEDARQVLPIATKSQIVQKANLREWRHIFSMRCDIYAHWEIRKVMLELLCWCKHNIPLIFDDFHFFTDKENKSYARKILPLNKINQHIEEYFISIKTDDLAFEQQRQFLLDIKNRLLDIEQ